MKRLLALALCMMLAIGTFAGCGQEDADAKVTAKTSILMWTLKSHLLCLN